MGEDDREDPRDRARAAQRAKSRALGERTDAPEEVDPEGHDIGDEHAASQTDPANAPTGGDTEKPTRA